GDNFAQHSTHRLAKKEAAIFGGRRSEVNSKKAYLGGVVVSVVLFFDFLPPLCDLLLVDFLPLLVVEVGVLVVLWSPLDPLVAWPNDSAPPSISVQAIRNSFFMCSPLKGSSECYLSKHADSGLVSRLLVLLKSWPGLSIGRDL